MGVKRYFEVRGFIQTYMFQGTLDELTLKYGTDKGSARHNYCIAYEEHFPKLQNSQVTLLEIGVLKGASLRMWKEYFPNAQIHGIDINPACKQYEEERIQIHIGDQSDPAFLNGIDANFDIIIDDGSHRWDHVVQSFEVLFPRLAPNGIYVVEDMLDCYNPYFAGIAGLNAINFLKNAVDNVNYHGLACKHEGTKALGWASLKDSLIHEKPTDYRNHIKSLHFYCGICFIKKHERKPL